MGSKLKTLLIFVIAAAVVGLGFWKKDDFNNMISSPASISLDPYLNKPGKYAFVFPRKWKVEDASSEGKFVSRTLVSPLEGGQRLGNVSQITVTIVATPGAGQPFSKQTEFEEWWSKSNQEIKGTGVIKLGNESVAGERAVRLAEVDIVEENINDSFWSVTTWFRRNSLNYYVNMMGNGSLSDIELNALSQMLGRFTFE
jgi:hypothetical protein